MFAVEFIAEVIDNAIHIPNEHRANINGLVRVIILTPEQDEASDFISELLENPIVISDFTPLTREEANHRL